jgi:hypothetical protein
MFGFRKAKIQATAAEQIGGCVVRARDFGMVMMTERRDLGGAFDAMPSFQPTSWVRLLAVAQLAHNLLGLLLVYRTINEAGIEEEWLPVTEAIGKILEKKSDFGPTALTELNGLIESNGENLENGKLARYGWGAWVISSLKREASGQSKGVSTSLEAGEEILAGAIDDYITKLFLKQFDVFYRH